MSWFNRTFFKLNFKNLILFAFLWLMVGFTTGTQTLMGPVRWIANIARQWGWQKNTEDLIVKFVIVLFVLGSFIIALWLVRTVFKSGLKHVKVGIPILVLIATLGALYFWMNPQVFGADSNISEETSLNTQFVFGPFPTEERMTELKEEGFTAVISLLHPAVIPFEPKLLAEEKQSAEKTDLELIHVPMLPWVSENKDALDKIRNLAETGRGRYYVHCYLGKDRVSVVKMTVEQAKSSIQKEYLDQDVNRREIKDWEAFERGTIFTLDDGVYLTPYPTDEEFFAFILNGSIKQVVSLLDPKNSEDKPWIDKESKVLSDYRIPFTVLPLPLSPYDPEKVLNIARKIRTLPSPKIVHCFLSPSPRTEAFLQAFRTNLPPLPPSFFKEPLAGGIVDVIAPHLAVGPRPEGKEFGALLFQRGVRKFAYLGNPDSPEAQEDVVITQDAGLDWQVFEPYRSDLTETVAKGGPWYLYGPNLPDTIALLKERFGPAIPDEVIFDTEILNSLPVEAEEPADTPPTEEEGEQIQTQSLFEKIVSFARNFLERALPDLKMIILLGPIFLLYAAIGGAYAGHLRINKNVRTPYTRKVFHFIIFSMAGLLHLAVGLKAVVLFGILVSLCVLYATFRGNGFPFYEAMARPTDEPHRTFFILVPLVTTALGGGISNLFFSKFAYIGYFVGGWGDAVGEPVGTKWGNHKYRVPSLLGVKATRSLEGSFAVFLTGAIVAFAALILAGYPPLKAHYVAIACGLAGAIIEAFSSHGLDNLTIQVAATATAYFLLK